MTAHLYRARRGRTWSSYLADTAARQLSRTALRKYRQVTSLPVQVWKAMNRKIGQLAVKVFLSNL